MEHVYWGPSFTDDQIAATLREPLADPALRMRRTRCEEELLQEGAALLDAGRIVGWYQGRMEWGPRALGNRSILADPRRPDMKDRLNARIKRREPFRPFAPSVLEESAAEYFEGSASDPFMVTVRPVRPEKRARIPAVVHVDGTGRLQTVSRGANPRFWSLLRAFEQRTGVPVLLNTSLNENEPIVNTPREALDCFLRVGIDVLVLGDWLVERTTPGAQG
jgi:carbamoyltransferase